MTSKSEAAVFPNTQKPETESEPSQASKKVFVEPEISSPASVLEATTFFQFVDSGVTNI